MLLLVILRWHVALLGGRYSVLASYYSNDNEEPRTDLQFRWLRSILHYRFALTLSCRRVMNWTAGRDESHWINWVPWMQYNWSSCFVNSAGNPEPVRIIPFIYRAPFESEYCAYSKQLLAGKVLNLGPRKCHITSLCTASLHAPQPRCHEAYYFELRHFGSAILACRPALCYASMVLGCCC
jgi:hypothetical protein